MSIGVFLALSGTARVVATSKPTSEWKTRVPMEVRKILHLSNPKDTTFVWKYVDSTNTVIFEVSKAPEEPKGRYM